MHLKGVNVKEAYPSFSFKTSVLKLLLDSLEQNGQKIAQIEDNTGKSCSFSDLLQQSKAIAAGLCKAGVAVGDMVIICCVKSTLAFSLQLGAMFTGATAVLIHPNFIEEIHKFASRHVVKAVFCDSVYLQSVNDVLGQMTPKPTLLATTATDDTTMTQLLLLPTDGFSLFEVKDVTKHVPLILFTSGSTSGPKGVQISDLALQRFGYTFEDESIETYLLITPFSWISCTISLISSILKGYTLVVSESKEPAVHMQLIEKYKVNGMTIPSANVNNYIKEPLLSSVDLNSLTMVYVGGEILKKKLTELFINQVLKGRIGIQNIYGMTETGVVTTWRNKDLLDLSKADSSGYLAPGVEIKILGDEGRGVSPGDLGELWVKTVSNTVGYWGQPEINSQVFDSSGFFRTGDVGYFDQDGFLYITGRASELISSKGTKVSVSEVEDVLKVHAEILDAAVIVKPHPTDAFHLTAFIVMKPGSHMTEEDVKKFIVEQAGETKTLKGGVYFIKEIPRTFTRKVHRRLLNEMMNKLQQPV